MLARSTFVAFISLLSGSGILHVNAESDECTSHLGSCFPTPDFYPVQFFEDTPRLITLERHSEAVMRLPNVDLCFVDVSNWDWNTDVVRIAHDRGAVQRYFEALDRGFIGQAIRERYTFDGQVGPDGIVQGTGMRIDELVISDLQEVLDDNDDRLEATQMVLSQGLANTDDPGIELVRTMVSMMEADPPAARRTRVLRADILSFLEDHELDVEKLDRLVDIMLEE
ncbi:hypothetical protein G7Z17_g248 [Cylindrodendrum hubeiense]|uniref:Secreted protein n=1 Tax=Cylindrodendrum hubeiense TaxID=595255 RepID=A0A9P5LGF7_9HYPO|nr:hypothetical protein G7Z17_g248 [Cylindrodendrum hubeiense]